MSHLKILSDIPATLIHCRLDFGSPLTTAVPTASGMIERITDTLSQFLKSIMD